MKQLFGFCDHIGNNQGLGNCYRPSASTEEHLPYNKP